MASREQTEQWAGDPLLAALTGFLMGGLSKAFYESWPQMKLAGLMYEPQFYIVAVSGQKYRVTIERVPDDEEVPGDV